MTEALNKRNYSLDIARIVAVLAVVMVHCSADFVIRYECFSGEFIFGNIFDGVSRIGVPLFLMISGALFLDEHKQISLKGILLKNVKSLAIITVIWAVIYSIVDNFVLNPSPSISAKSIVDGIVYGYYHMWYLYMIIGLYIIAPFLRKFVCKENRNQVLFFILLSFAVQFVAPLLNKLALRYLGVNYIGAFVDMLHLDFFGGYITYFLVGWYIVHVGIKKKWLTYTMYILGVAAFVAIVLYVHFTGDYKNAYSNIGVPVFFYAVSVFMALTNIKICVGKKSSKLLIALSKLTFGVYIIHAMVLDFYTKWLPYKSNALLYIAVCFASVVAISAAISFVLSKIPVIKKLIRG